MNPFVVEVQDGNGDPSVGVAVTFAVTAGGGSLNPETTVTRPDGRVASTLTLGRVAGTNSVQVSVPGISETLVFTAEGIAPETPTTLVIISGNNQSWSHRWDFGEPLCR